MNALRYHAGTRSINLPPSRTAPPGPPRDYVAVVYGYEDGSRLARGYHVVDDGEPIPGWLPRLGRLVGECRGDVAATDRWVAEWTEREWRGLPHA